MDLSDDDMDAMPTGWHKKSFSMVKALTIQHTHTHSMIYNEFQLSTVHIYLFSYEKPSLWVKVLQFDFLNQ